MKDIVSVVVPTYNREETLCETLDQLHDQDYPNFTVHIVDHTSRHSSETEEYLESLSEQFHHHKLSEGGLCTARNYGLKKAKGDIILYIDDDVDFSEDFISSHVREYSDPSVGAVAGQVLNPRHAEPVNRPPKGRITWYGRSVSRLHSNQPGNVGEGRGCNMSFRKNLLNSIGGFDTGLDFRDESDVFHRIRDEDYLVRFSPTASVYHKESERGGTIFSGQQSREEIEQISRNKHYFHLKNKPLVTFPFAVLTSIMYQAKVRNTEIHKFPRDTISILKGSVVAIRNWLS